MNPAHDALNPSNKNFVLFVAHEDSVALADSLASKGYLRFCFDGADIPSKDALLGHFAQELGFPDYFGYNWDALEECLRDLQWLPANGYILQLANADQYIERCLSDFETLIEIMETVSKHWGRAGVDFFFLVETNQPGLGARRA